MRIVKQLPFHVVLGAVRDEACRGHMAPRGPPPAQSPLPGTKSINFNLDGISQDLPMLRLLVVSCLETPRIFH